MIASDLESRNIFQINEEDKNYDYESSEQTFEFSSEFAKPMSKVHQTSNQLTIGSTEYSSSLSKGLEFSPKNAKIWKEIDIDKYLFFGIVTHEARSSLSNEIFLPYARFDDRSMYFCAIQHSN